MIWEFFYTETRNQGTNLFHSCESIAGNHPFSAYTDFSRKTNISYPLIRTLTTNCLSVFDHFVGLVLKGLKATNQFSQQTAFLKVCKRINGRD